MPSGEKGNRDDRTRGIRLDVSPDLGFFLSGGRPPWYWPERRASAKDIIESFGIPHTEVGQIRFNGKKAGYAFVPEGAGVMEVRGIWPPFDVCAADDLRPVPLPAVRFVADLNVLKLGQFLLFLGYDTVLARQESDAWIAGLAASEHRIVLTRDTRLLFRRNITHGRRLRSVYPLEQVTEVLDFFGLRPDPAQFFSRCARCNRPLEPVPKASVYHRLEPRTRKYVHRFHRCPGCGRIYWAGSHHAALQERFRNLGLWT